MTEMTLSAPAATGPPGPAPLTGTNPGGQSARAAACAGPLTAEASPFDLLLSLLTGTPSGDTSPGGVGATTPASAEDDSGEEGESSAALPTAATEDPTAALALLNLVPTAAVPAFAPPSAEAFAAAAGGETAAPAALSPVMSAALPHAEAPPAVTAGGVAAFPASGSSAAGTVAVAPLVAQAAVPAPVRPPGPANAPQIPAMAAVLASTSLPVAEPTTPLPAVQDPLVDVAAAAAPATSMPVDVSPEAALPAVPEARAEPQPEGVDGETAAAEIPLLPETDAASTGETAPTELRPGGAAALTASNAAERPDPADRVLEPLRTHLREMPAAPGRHEVTLTLTPESLGELRVRLSTGPGGEVRAAITATTPEAQASLLNASESLRSTLADRGLRLDGFTVTLDASGPGSAGRGGIQQPDAAGQASGSQTFPGGGGQNQNGAFRPSYAASRGYRDENDAAAQGIAPAGLVGGGSVSAAAAGHLNLLA